MALEPESIQRLTELLDRLCQPGPKASHVSASELHEVVDLATESLAEVARLRKLLGATAMTADQTLAAEIGAVLKTNAKASSRS